MTLVFHLLRKKIPHLKLFFVYKVDDHKSNSIRTNIFCTSEQRNIEINLFGCYGVDGVGSFYLSFHKT